MDNTLTVDSTQHRPKIEQTLSESRRVLEEPLGLPPKRTFDHRIMLKGETQPVNTDPYRYRQF